MKYLTLGLSRIFVGSLLCLSLFGGLGCASVFNDYASDYWTMGSEGFPIMQGPTTETTAQLNVVIPVKSDLWFKVYEDESDELVKGSYSQRFQPRGKSFAVQQLSYRDLKPATQYRLEVTGVGGKKLDVRFFRTLEVARSQVKFAFASCMDDHEDFAEAQVKMWDSLVGEKPDFIIFGGDNVYADQTIQTYQGPAPPKVIWLRYLETRHQLQIFRIKNLIPIIALWDDHDFGQNNGDRTYPYVGETQQIFKTFFTQRTEKGEFEEGPGVSSYFKAFGQRFFFLDDRSFRSPNGDETRHQTHFGSEQERWLFQKLMKSQDPAWLISGDQWFGGYHRFESYEGNHRKSFVRFLAKLRKVRAPVVFLSGDRHLSEMMQIDRNILGYPTFEFTSSGIHAKTFPSTWEKEPNPRQVEGRAHVLNYMLLDVKRDEGAPLIDIHVKAMGPPEQGVLFEKTVRVERARLASDSQ